MTTEQSALNFCISRLIYVQRSDTSDTNRGSSECLGVCTTSCSMHGHYYSAPTHGRFGNNFHASGFVMVLMLLVKVSQTYNPKQL
jgi:hypothetical protein